MHERVHVPLHITRCTIRGRHDAVWESYQHAMADEIKLVYCIALFNDHFPGKKKLFLQPDYLQSQSEANNYKNECLLPHVLCSIMYPSTRFRG